MKESLSNFQLPLTGFFGLEQQPEQSETYLSVTSANGDFKGQEELTKLNDEIQLDC